MTRAAAPLPETRISVLERIFIGGLVLIFGLIVLHAPLSVFLGVHFGHDLLFKAWKELLMGLLLVVALVVVTRRRAWSIFRRDPIIWISAALAVLYVVSLQFGHGFKPYAAGLLIDLRYILYAVLVYVAIRLFPQARPLFIRVGLIGAIVVVGFGLLQFVLPKDFLSVFGYSNATITPYTTIDSYQGLVRLQSTMRGPNPLGAYAMIVALVTGAAALRGGFERRAKIWLWILAAASLVVLFGSYSRSAYVGLLVGAVVMAALMVGRRRLLSRKVVLTLIAGVVIIVAGLYAIRNTTFYSSVLKHEVAGSGPAVNSDAGHSSSLREGWAAFVKNPLGSGTGSTGSASLLSANGYIVENQFLFVAHEAGWAALAAFLALFGLLLRRAYACRNDWMALGVAASGVGLLAVGMLLPVFADDTVSIVWFGQAGLIAASASPMVAAERKTHVAE